MFLIIQDFNVCCLLFIYLFRSPRAKWYEWCTGCSGPSWNTWSARRPRSKTVSHIFNSILIFKLLIDIKPFKIGRDGSDGVNGKDGTPGTAGAAGLSLQLCLFFVNFRCKINHHCTNCILKDPLEHRGRMQKTEEMEQLDRQVYTSTITFNMADSIFGVLF